MEITSVVIILFFVMDPLGNIPIFLSVLEGVQPNRRRRVLARELLFSLIILMIFLFGGRYILQFFSLTQASVSIAGAIVLLFIAIRMVFPSKQEWLDDIPAGEPFIVPLAIPFFAGPSTLATVMLLTTKEPGKLVELSLATFIAWLAGATILMSSTLLYRVLRKRGLIALERLMGMLLVAIAVQMFLNGFSMYLADHSFANQ